MFNIERISVQIYIDRLKDRWGMSSSPFIVIGLAVISIYTFTKGCAVVLAGTLTQGGAHFLNPTGVTIVQKIATSATTAKNLLAGFIAGFLATLVFHQLTLSLLWHAGIAPFGPFSMAPTQPFGVPAVFSLAFWGGVWGIIFAIFQGKFPRGGRYWLVAFLFGAILPSLIAFFVVLPLKGRPIGNGWHPSFLLTAFLINGAWGIGTGVMVKALSSRR